MGIISIFLIALSLAMDAFAVSVSNGLLLKNIKISNAIKFGVFFGVFQFIMPILGWVFAKNFSSVIKSFDHWIAFSLLVLIGGKMFIDTFKNEDELNIKDEVNILSIYNLTILAIATSIDALAVGVSFALIDINIWFSSSVIGIVAFILSFLGVIIGKQIGFIFQKNAERAGGIILIFIGTRILIEHIFL